MKISINAFLLTLLIADSNCFSVQPNQRLPSTQKSTTTRDVSKLKTYGQVLIERSDTLKSAGLYDPKESEYPPLAAGAKTNITLFCVALGYKWYRSIFINKLAIWERQPQWNTVITSKEDEEKANLEAMTCNDCGSTIFIAKGRKWFQMPKGYTCYCCGSTGEDAFSNTRKDLLEEVDDDYFEYEKPLDFVTAAERKKLMKEAGGDESKASAMLTQGGTATQEETETGDVEKPKKKKKKKKGKKSKKKKEGTDETDVKSVSSDADAVVEVEVKDEDATATENDKDAPKKNSDDLDALGMD